MLMRPNKRRDARKKDKRGARLTSRSIRRMGRYHVKRKVKDDEKIKRRAAGNAYKHRSLAQAAPVQAGRTAVKASDGRKKRRLR